jgi:mannose-6-phosphate isomerase class I
VAQQSVTEAPSGDFARYDSQPRHRLDRGQIDRGWDRALGALPPDTAVLAVDGPAALDWEQVAREIKQAWGSEGREIATLAMQDFLLPWDELVARTEPPSKLDGDRDFIALPDFGLEELFRLPEVPETERPLLVYGPGAALIEHDALWYIDVPKRFVEKALVTRSAPNMGQAADGRGTAKRLFYIDWPLLDRHRDTIAPKIQRFIDLSDPSVPTSVDGDGLRATFERLTTQPFRTLPVFNSVAWGGHWAQRTLGYDPDAKNTAIGYELIAPEASILLHDDEATIEVPFGLMVALDPDAVLGEAVARTFGTSFPIRFDYLDTVDGENLSIHCHPRLEYMRELFGLHYTQDETYYIVEGNEDGAAEPNVFLGLREDADVEQFHRDARAAVDHRVGFDPGHYVQTFPSTRGQLFMIPGGTPHASGRGNVVLEVSATPYLYALRFYDWLRTDAAGNPRPVHVEHAFRNLDTERRGDQVARDLVQEPRPLRSGDGWDEEVIGDLPEYFYEVRRVNIEPGSVVPDDTAGRFHLLNVVDGLGVELSTADGRVQVLNRAETAVVPAACGSYSLRSLGDRPTRLVKSLVK